MQKTHEIILVLLEPHREPIALYIDNVLRRSSNILATTFLDLLPQGELMIWEQRQMSLDWAKKHEFHQFPDYFLPDRLTDIPFEAFENQDKWKIPFRAY